MWFTFILEIWMFFFRDTINFLGSVFGKIRWLPQSDFKMPNPFYLLLGAVFQDFSPLNTYFFNRISQQNVLQHDEYTHIPSKTSIII